MVASVKPVSPTISVSEPTARTIDDVTTAAASRSNRQLIVIHDRPLSTLEPVSEPTTDHEQKQPQRGGRHRARQSARRGWWNAYSRAWPIQLRLTLLLILVTGIATVAVVVGIVGRLLVAVS